MNSFPQALTEEEFNNIIANCRQLESGEWIHCEACLKLFEEADVQVAGQGVDSEMHFDFSQILSSLPSAPNESARTGKMPHGDIFFMNPFPNTGDSIDLNSEVQCSNLGSQTGERIPLFNSDILREALAATESSSYELITEVDNSYRPPSSNESQTINRFGSGFNQYPGAGTMYGGGRNNAETNLSNDAKWLRVAELWYQRPYLMKAGEERNKDHKRQVNAHWRYIQEKLESEGFEDTNLRNGFNRFRNDTLNKLRSMKQTGAARIDLSNAETFIQDKEKDDEGVYGTNVADAGHTEQQQPPAPSQQRPKRIAKPRQLLTYTPPQPKKGKSNVVETPEFDNNFDSMEWDSPVPRPSYRNSGASSSAQVAGPSNRNSGNSSSVQVAGPSNRNSGNSSSAQVAGPSNRNSGRSSRAQSSAAQSSNGRQSDFWDDVIQLSDDETKSISTCSDDDEHGISPKTPKQQTKQPTKKDTKAKTGIDKKVSLGPTPLSQKGQFLMDGMDKMTETVAAAAAKINRETESRIKETESRAELQTTLAPVAAEMAQLQKEKLKAEAEEAKHKAAEAEQRARKEKEEADLASLRRQVEEAKLKKELLELQRLQQQQP